jgi:benzoate/toluate 1,2-dioxygenase alpha subunit
MLDTAIQKKLDTAMEDDPANGVYRVSRDIFTDPEIFELDTAVAIAVTLPSL